MVLGLGTQLNTFSYAELRAATDDFNSSNRLGEGGFGHVHKVNSIFFTVFYLKNEFTS